MNIILKIRSLYFKILLQQDNEKRAGAINLFYELCDYVQQNSGMFEPTEIIYISNLKI